MALDTSREARAGFLALDTSHEARASFRLLGLCLVRVVALAGLEPQNPSFSAHFPLLRKGLNPHPTPGPMSGTLPYESDSSVTLCTLAFPLNPPVRLYLATMESYLVPFP